MVKFQFRGLMCPVFTPFTDDKKTINYNVIERYAQFLNSKGVQGILVNGITGEGTELRLDERRRLAEEWLKVCRKYGMTMLLCIGGCPITEVYELCEHAEKIGVDCIVLLPDLFYKPAIEEDLVEYIKHVVRFCPTRPIYYYHIPEYTRVDLEMVRLCKLTDRNITNFCGIFYGDRDIVKALDLWREGHHCIMTHHTLMPGLMGLGFDTFCLITLNIWPDHVKEVYNLMCNWKSHEAHGVFIRLLDSIKDTVKDTVKTTTTEYDVVEVFKRKFNSLVDFKVGDLRKPKITVTRTRTN